ncbi:MAG: hypothetical protein PHV32_11800 [Eubacteriales bacterium]|nr:hypothetical protein [Eubacteriales bacterium]
MKVLRNQSIRMHGHVILLLSILLTIIAFTACSSDESDREPGLAIYSLHSSIGSVGDTDDINTQAFTYTLTITNNDIVEINLLEVKPVLCSPFAEIVLNDDLSVQVKKVIPAGESISVEGLIIFDATGLSKEEILDMEPFIKEVKLIEGRTIVIFAPA